MKYDDEILALQERLAALEAQKTAVAVVDDGPTVEYTDEYLGSLTPDELGAVYKAGKIDVATFGSIVARREIKEDLRERVAELEAELAKLAPAAAAPAPAEETPAEEPAAASEEKPAADAGTEAGAQ